MHWFAKPASLPGLRPFESDTWCHCDCDDLRARGLFGSIAQLVEHLAVNHVVVGSSPTAFANFNKDGGFNARVYLPH